VKYELAAYRRLNRRLYHGKTTNCLNLSMVASRCHRQNQTISLYLFPFSDSAQARQQGAKRTFPVTSTLSRRRNRAIRAKRKARLMLSNSSMTGDCKECHSSEDGDPVVRVDDRKFVDPYAGKLKIAPPPEATAWQTKARSKLPRPRRTG
jgi:hypothetical protein